MLDSILNGDCIDTLHCIQDASVDLLYIDPPFFTQKIHSLKTKDRKKEYAFSDVWPSRSEYLSYLRPRVEASVAKLRTTGTIFFHCDTSASHHIRCLLDELLGEDMFRSEIIWNYKRWANSQRAPLPSHQTIFFYSKSEQYTFNPLFGDYSETTNIEQILQRRERDADGKSVYERDVTGSAVLDGAKRGVPVGDVWDIPLLNPKAKERVGYPTQKPILLLERVIELVTSAGDTVLDPFCGSGTTLVAAKLLGRHFIGIDASEDACSLARARLDAPIRTSSAMLLKGRESYNQVDRESLLVLSELGVLPVHRNKGIDAILPTGPGMKPVLIRVQKSNESRLTAAELLRSAGASKQPAVLVLIVTDDHLPAGLFDEIPPEVRVLPSVGAGVARLLRDLNIALPQPATTPSRTKAGAQTILTPEAQ